jgi:hypothetical protein
MLIRTTYCTTFISSPLSAECCAAAIPSFAKFTLVLYNLNTHMRDGFEEVLGVKGAAKLLRRIEFHYTHGRIMQRRGRYLSQSDPAGACTLPALQSEE